MIIWSHFWTNRSKRSQHLAGLKSNLDTWAGDWATESNLVHQHLQASRLLGGRGWGGVGCVHVCVSVGWGWGWGVWGLGFWMRWGRGVWMRCVQWGTCSSVGSGDIRPSHMTTCQPVMPWPPGMMGGLAEQVFVWCLWMCMCRFIGLII